jgi:hypothetical protein
MLENLIKKHQPNNILLNDWNNGETIALISNKDCVIQMINPFAIKNLGYNSEEVVEKMLVDDFFDKDELLTIAKSLIKDFDTKYQNKHCLYALIKEFGEVNELKLNMIRKNGSKFPVILSIVKTSDEDACYALTANFNSAKKISELIDT